MKEKKPNALTFENNNPECLDIFARTNNSCIECLDDALRTETFIKFNYYNNSMEKNICVKCGYAWYGRVENSLACPRCKRYDWKEGKKNETKIKTKSKI